MERLFGTVNTELLSDLPGHLVGVTPASAPRLSLAELDRAVATFIACLLYTSGPHTFRHARAVSLLRSAAPLKAIGDILGHRSALSTGAYLKLATEDLRAVALDVPTAVSP